MNYMRECYVNMLVIAACGAVLWYLAPVAWDLVVEIWEVCHGRERAD